MAERGSSLKLVVIKLSEIRRASLRTILNLSFCILMVATARAQAREAGTCDVIDPIKVEFGGKYYSIPAIYQPKFGSDKEGKVEFYVQEQNYYKDGKRLKNRYCRRNGHQKVNSFRFDLEYGSSRRQDGYDVRDAIVGRASSAFDGLSKVSMIHIVQTPSSNEPDLNDRIFENAPLSSTGTFRYKSRHSGCDKETQECFWKLLSVKPTIFGGRANASRLNFESNPLASSWRVAIAADKLIQPHGSVVLDVQQTKFEDWPAAFEAVKRFLESMQSAKN